MFILHDNKISEVYVKEVISTDESIVPGGRGFYLVPYHEDILLSGSLYRSICAPIAIERVTYCKEGFDMHDFNNFDTDQLRKKFYWVDLAEAKEFDMTDINNETVIGLIGKEHICG